MNIIALSDRFGSSCRLLFILIALQEPNYQLMKQTICNILTLCPLFKGMAEHEAKEAFDRILWKEVAYNRRSFYYIKGEQHPNVDIVTKGELVVRLIGTSGRLLEVTRIHEGDLIAPCFVLSSEKHLPVEIEAVTEVSLVRATQEEFNTLLDSDTRISHNFIRFLSDTTSFLASKIGFLSLMTIKEKLIYYLREQVMEQKSMQITLKHSRQRIADMFAIQKYSLLRCLSELEKQGLIKIDGRTITILDMKRMK